MIRTNLNESEIAETDGMLVEVSVENLRFVLLVSWCERTHPGQLELPVVQFIGCLQGSDAPIISLVLAFQKAIAVVCHCHKGEFAEICHYVAGIEPRCVTVGVVVAEIEATIQTTVCRNLQFLWYNPIAGIAVRL